MQASIIEWAHKPSPFAWSVLIYGGANPRTGNPQPNEEVQFHKRTREGGAGFGVPGILWRANDYAQHQHRTHFAVRDTDGAVIYNGPVLDELEAPRVFAAIRVNVALRRRAA